MSQQAQSFFPQNYVADIVGHKIYLKNVSEQMINTIKETSAFQDKIAGQAYWVISYTSEADLVSKLDVLNKLGFLFVDEPAGWPPAAIFEYLREKYHINVKFKSVIWRGPGDWYIIER